MSTRTKTKPPHKTARKTAAKTSRASATADEQERIDDEVQTFLNATAAQASELADRTDEPIEIVRSLMIGAAVIAGRRMNPPSRSDREALADVIKTLELASKGVIKVRSAPSPLSQEYKRKPGSARS